jgi:signal transduction histidine kinase
LTVALRSETDVLLARKRVRQIARIIGFSVGDSTRITTALAEIARNAFVYGGGGTVTFFIEDHLKKTQSLAIDVVDKGPGFANLATILAGKYGSQTGMGIGITGSRALMDTFQITTVTGAGGGTRVQMSKVLPRTAPRIGPLEIARLTDDLAAGDDHSPFGELQVQNQELLLALDEITHRQAEVERLSLVAEEARVRAEEAQTVAERSLVVQERFMALTTHEIRTPLNAMLGYLELVEMQLEELLTEKQVEYFLKARRACNHLIGITNDFLDMAKGEAGHLKVARHAGAARHVISDAAALVAPQAAARGVEITLTETTERIMYLGDGDRVRQVLINVLGNAVSFSPAGGKIRVTAARVDDPPQGSELSGGPWCAIRVEDSGPGIPPDKVSRVFDPFVQVASGSHAGRKGTGLGLTVSRQLALLMGGDLTVEGSAGIDGGAAFTLWLAAGGGPTVAPTVSPDSEVTRSVSMRADGQTDAGVVGDENTVERPEQKHTG